MMTLAWGYTDNSTGIYFNWDLLQLRYTDSTGIYSLSPEVYRLSPEVYRLSPEVYSLSPEVYRLT